MTMENIASNKKVIAILLVCIALILVFLISCKFSKCFKGERDMTKIESIDTVFGQGEPNPFGKFFTGQTYLKSMVEPDDVFYTNIGNVVFEPGARTNWHSHTAGKILLVLDGEGRYQEKGKEVQILKKGDVVKIVPDVEHWHGAAPDSWFVHVSITPNSSNNKTTWLEPVSDAEYKYLN